jgi:hypothetical protein
MVLEPRLLEKHNANPYIQARNFGAQRSFRIILDSFQLIMRHNHCRHYDFRVRKSGEIAIWTTKKSWGDARLGFSIHQFDKNTRRRQTFDMGIVNEDNEKDTMLDFLNKRISCSLFSQDFYKKLIWTISWFKKKRTMVQRERKKNWCLLVYFRQMNETNSGLWYKRNGLDALVLIF